MFRRLDERTLVAGQIGPEDVPEAAARGVTMIINNRPDGEVPGQPGSAELEAAAAAAGIGYRHIPVSGGFSADQVTQMEAALTTQGQALIFCTSGTRSTYLWALARAKAGEDGSEIMRRAAEAGYDLTPLQGYLT